VKLILDFPWDFEELRYNADAHELIGSFVNLLRATKADAVKILPTSAVDDIYVQLAKLRGNSPLRLLFQLLPELAGELADGPEAVPQCKAAATVDFKKALHREINVGNWRTPQIITSLERRGHWGPGEEVVIVFNGTETERIVVSASAHASHPWARSDYDPWILSRTDETAVDPEKRFRLPKPSACTDAELSDLCNTIDQKCGSWTEQRNGNDRYVFIPPRDWSPALEKQKWRVGNVFRKEKCSESDRSGYLDRHGHLWVWDDNEKHWDVQMDRRCRKNDYYKISATGRRLDE